MCILKTTGCFDIFFSEWAKVAGHESKRGENDRLLEPCQKGHTSSSMCLSPNTLSMPVNSIPFEEFRPHVDSWSSSSLQQIYHPQNY